MGRDDTSARFKKTNCEMRIMNLTKSSQDSVPLYNTRVLMQKRSWWDYIFQRYRRETVDGISKMNVGFSLSRPECGWRTNLNVGGSLSRPKFGRESEPPTFRFVCTGLHTVRESEHEPSCPDGYMDGRSWMSEVHFPGRVFSFWLPLVIPTYIHKTPASSYPMCSECTVCTVALCFRICSSLLQ